jgi:hydrophobic/amphiphilic exporter-1 (mainly G- bacteria), HAE1 family
MLASRWLRTEEKTGRNPLHRFGRWWDENFDRLSRSVARLVPMAVTSRWIVVLVSIALVVGVGALVPLGLIPSEYAPQEDDSNFQLNVQTPPGTSLSRTNEIAQQMEAVIQQVPEVQYVFTSVSGGGGGGFGRPGGRASFAVQLKPKQERERTVFEIMDQLRATGRNLPGATVNADVQSPLGVAGGFGGGGLTSINLQLAGPDLDTLNQLSDEVLATMLTIPGITDARNTSNAGTPELHVELDRMRMAQLNVTSQAVATALRTAIAGSLVTEFRPAGQAQQDVTMLAVDSQRYDLNSLSAIPVGTGSAAGAGAATPTTSTTPSIVTLGQIATITYGTGPVSIQRVDRNRTMTITGTASGRALGDVAKDVQTAMRSIQFPAGYSFQLRGGVQQLNNSFTILGQALVLSIVLEYMLLVALYESWFYPIVLILGVPLGVVGSLLGLYVTHNTLNIFSVIGLIMAVGLVAKNGILLVDFTNTLRKRGMERTAALAEAARVRLRPILMTTSTMSLGMLPLALKLEPGAESRAPMAVVVIGGLLSSTFLAIFVTPALYTMLDDLQNLILRPKRFAPGPIPAEHVVVPVPAAAPSPVATATTTSVHDGHGGNGQRGASGVNGASGSNGANGAHAEPLWLQRLKARSFGEDDQ